MFKQPPAFSSDPSHLLDIGELSPASVFNDMILPRVTAFDEEDPGGLEEAGREREAQLQQDLSQEAFSRQADDDFLAQLDRNNQPSPAMNEEPEENYDVSVNTPASATGGNTKAASSGSIKLSNYGYDSDSSPDHNSNVLRIGHANNKLEDGISAALTKSLAKRHGLKTGDMFEAVTADGKILKRRYDDTVPTTYRGKALPPTVDLYELSGSNNFGGTITSIRKLNK